MVWGFWQPVSELTSSQVAIFTELRNTYVVKKEQDRTRDLVVRAILERGPATAVELAERLNITPAGIRRHLDSLVSEGLLQSRDAHVTSTHSRGRGRPSKVFVMTDRGREKFENSYDDLAASALRFMSSNGDRSFVKKFAVERARELKKRAEGKMNLQLSRNLQEKSEDLAHVLSEDGYLSTVNHKAIGVEICHHHCPVAHVASEFPEFCEAETEMLSELLGTHVQRLATIANGDGVCTTFVPTLASVRSKKFDSKKSQSPQKADEGARK